MSGVGKADIRRQTTALCSQQHFLSYHLISEAVRGQELKNAVVGHDIFRSDVHTGHDRRRAAAAQRCTRDFAEGRLVKSAETAQMRKAVAQRNSGYLSFFA